VGRLDVEMTRSRAANADMASRRRALVGGVLSA